MVSNAREDLPEPESPVITVILLRGISTFIFFRLCIFAPLITILSICERSKKTPCAKHERELELIRKRAPCLGSMARERGEGRGKKRFFPHIFFLFCFESLLSFSLLS